MQEQPQHYELALIIPGSIAEDQHPTILTEVKDLISENGGEITYEGDLGRRKLAYVINQLRHGFYFVLEFNLTAKNLKKIDKTLKLNNNILRFMVVKKHEKTAEEIKQEEQLRAGKAKEQLKKQLAEVEEKPAEKSTAKPKMSLEDLDKKLDELLDDEKVI